VGWFYGFKVHIIINCVGEILDFTITTGNVADNNPKLIEQMVQKIHGKLYGDKGYLLNPELFQKLYSDGIHVVTKIKNNMKNKLMDIGDKIMLKKRGLIESVGAVLKEDLNIEHSRYRSPITLFINVFSALIAYSFRKNKPSIHKIHLVS
jgi:Transposase DDE domain